jgi:CRISPR/Cas system-associated protein Csm6
MITLLRMDPVTTMSDSSCNGLANNIHFLIMRDMYEAVKAQRIAPDNIRLQYTTDTHEGRFCAKVIIMEEGEGRGERKRIVSDRVENQSEALESLRKVVERAVYGD